MCSYLDPRPGSSALVQQGPLVGASGDWPYGWLPVRWAHATLTHSGALSLPRLASHCVPHPSGWAMDQSPPHPTMGMSEYSHCQKIQFGMWTNIKLYLGTLPSRRSHLSLHSSNINMQIWSTNKQLMSANSIFLPTHTGRMRIFIHLL